jgi:hypothetical protein
VLGRLDAPTQELVALYGRKLSGADLVELNRLLEALYADEV